MRIAIDARPLTGRYTGDRTYWLNLARALLKGDSENEYVLYSRLPMPEGELPETPNLTCVTLNASNDRLWAMATLPRALSKDRADVLHVQYTTPARVACPVITTVHDVSFRLYPQWFPVKHRALLNLTVPPSMRRAAKVITDSESSRRDILRFYPFVEEKLVAIPLGLPDGFHAPQEGEATETKEEARAFVREKFQLDTPFLLAVGVLQPRKNLPLLVEAFGMAKVKFNLPHQLALTGKAGWGTERETLYDLLTRHGASREDLLFTGYVDDADLPRLYRACAAFAYPSLYEGFGFPPLEAMACDAPTLVSDAPAMPEVVGDAAHLVPATDKDAWANAIGEVLLDEDRQNDLIQRGRERVRRFTWQETATRTREIYHEVAAQRR